MNKFYYEKRLERMLEMMSDLSIDAALITEPAVAQYLTGLSLAYQGTSMPTLITRQGKIFIFARPLEAAEARDDAVLGEVEGPANAAKLEAYLLEHLVSLRMKKLGIDWNRTPHSLAQRLTGKLGEPSE